MRIILYNIAYASGPYNKLLDGFRFYRYLNETKGLVAQMSKYLAAYKPDVLALLESDSGSIRTFGISQISRLAENLKLSNITHNCKYSDFVSHIPLLKYQHHAIITKYKILSSYDYVLRHGFKKLVLGVTVNAHNKSILSLLTHLSLYGPTQKKQIEELESIVEENKNKSMVLMGDFNSGPEVMGALAEQANLQIISPGKTYPSWHPKRALDYFLLSEDLKVIKTKVLDTNLSDHKPVFLELK